MRPRRRRHLHPALLRGGLRGPAGVHRPGDPAHQPGLGHPADDRRSASATSRAFPFVEPPDRRQVTDGVRLLEELGALDRRRRAGPAQAAHRRRPQARPAAGRPAAGPDGARGRDATAALREVLVIAAGPVDPGPARAARRTSRQQADEQHARFADEHSDFLACLNLWHYLREQQQRAVRQRRSAGCAERVPALPAGPRVAGPAQPAHGGVAKTARPAAELATTADADRRAPVAAGRAALARRAARRRRSASTSAPAAPGSRICPGSALFKKPPQLGDGRRAGRDLPAVGPRQRPRSSPSGSSRWPGTWSSAPTASRTGQQAPGAAVAYEKVTLYGVPLVAGRKVNYGRIDPEASRELFIRHALVEGDWHTHHEFFHDNRALLERGRGARAPGPAARHPGRRRDAVRVLRRAGARRRRVRRGTSTPGGRRPAASSPTCSTFTERPAGQRRRRLRQRRGLPATLASRASCGCR